MKHNTSGNTGIVRVSDIRDTLIRRFEINGVHAFESVSGSMSASQQEKAIKRNYVTFETRVRLGVDDWNRSCPYEIADWLTVLSTPEFGAWQDIRSCGLPLWPRLPVGEFTVSFGNPAAKVALQVGIEYDGVSADELRADHWLKQIGWRVFRVPFERCLRVMDTPADVRERTGECNDEYRAAYLTETLAGTIQELRHALIAAGARL
jgi:very-short-patch-repair endonuclease